MNHKIEYRTEEEWCKYHCFKCKFSEWVMADIIGEFADMDKFLGETYTSVEEDRRKSMPILECPHCNANFYYSGESKIEEYVHFAENEDDIPF